MSQTEQNRSEELWVLFADVYKHIAFFKAPFPEAVVQFSREAVAYAQSDDLRHLHAAMAHGPGLQALISGEPERKWMVTPENARGLLITHGDYLLAKFDAGGPVRSEEPQVSPGPTAPPPSTEEEFPFAQSPEREPCSNDFPVHIFGSASEFLRQASEQCRVPVGVPAMQMLGVISEFVNADETAGMRNL